MKWVLRGDWGWDDLYHTFNDCRAQHRNVLLVRKIMTLRQRYGIMISFVRLLQSIAYHCLKDNGTARQSVSTSHILLYWECLVIWYGRWRERLLNEFLVACFAGAKEAQGSNLIIWKKGTNAAAEYKLSVSFLWHQSSDSIGDGSVGKCKKIGTWTANLPRFSRMSEMVHTVDLFTKDRSGSRLHFKEAIS